MQVINLISRFLTYNVAVFLLVLGVLIFVHEFGHFIFARLFGVRVLIFKLGFGRFVWSFKRGPTEYGVALFPVGGYVKMFGDPSEMEELKPEEVNPAERREALFAQPRWKQLFIFAGGPLMNVVMAFVIAPVVYLVGIERPKAYLEPPVIGAVFPDSPAAKAGIEPGDRVLSVAGKPMDRFQDLIIEEAINPKQTLVYRIRRGGKEFQVTLTLEEGKTEPVGTSGIMLPRIPAAIEQPLPGMPAAQAGFQKDDRILAINDTPVQYWDELRHLIEASQGEQIRFRVERGQSELVLRVTPVKDPEENRFVIGITPRIETVLVRTGLVEAIQRGSDDVAEAGVLTVAMLWKILSLQTSPRALGGPVMIAGTVGEAAQSSFANLVWIVVLISVSLGIFNILPLPPFDGGHILFTVIEAVLRREINLKYKEAIFRVAMTFILVLFVLITVNDIMRYRQGIAGWFQELAKGLGLL